MHPAKWVGGCLVRAEQPKETAESKSEPEARVLYLVGARAANSGNTSRRPIAAPSKESTKSQHRRMGHAGGRHGLFWMLILYLVLVIGTTVGTMAYLLL
jgi:hypothetical protein